MQFIKKEYKKFKKSSYNSFILGGDIGGTNTNLGIFGVKNNFPSLLASFHFKSKELKALHYAINEVLDYMQKNHKIKINNACFAVAGVLSPRRDYVSITNIRWDASKKILLEKTRLKKILLMNDFEAIGFGINMLAKKDIAVIKVAAKITKSPIIVIGAGTGLGKSTLTYDEHYKSYIPMPSEAGHSDFAAQSYIELELVNFIKRHNNINQSISYEQVLSGNGLSNIYSFLRKNRKFKETSFTKEIDKSKAKPELISKYRKTDETCRATFEIFKKIYAKFAKNFALDALPLGGVYIAGGIAPKNRDIFNGGFVKLFEQNYRHADVLKRIPIYLVLNYNVGLLGAGFAGAKFLQQSNKNSERG